MYSCEYCGFKAKLKKNITGHFRDFHKIKSDISRVVKCNKEGSVEMNECKQCDYKTKLKHNLTRHNRIIHQIKSEIPYVKCKENGCHESFRTIRSFRNHLLDEHERETETENLCFKSRKAFCNWKKQEEKDKNVHFVLHSGSWRRNQSECSYYYCNRTGIFNSKAARPPIKKLLGTVKLNSHCTAGLTVTVAARGINVLYYKTHYNHNPEHEPILHKSPAVSAKQKPKVLKTKTPIISIKQAVSCSKIQKTKIPIISKDMSPGVLKKKIIISKKKILAALSKSMTPGSRQVIRVILPNKGTPFSQKKVPTCTPQIVRLTVPQPVKEISQTAGLADVTKMVDAALPQSDTESTQQIVSVESLEMDTGILLQANYAFPQTYIAVRPETTILTEPSSSQMQTVMAASSQIAVDSLPGTAIAYSTENVMESSFLNVVSEETITTITQNPLEVATVLLETVRSTKF